LSGITGQTWGNGHDGIRGVKAGYQSSVCTTVHSQNLTFTSHSWDDVYEKEVANFEETGDEGEIWCVNLFQRRCFFFSIWHALLCRFGEDSVEKMVNWTLENIPITSQPHILEIGSGNGTLLFVLHEAGYAASHLTGIDYSPDAVKFACMVARSQNCE